MLAVLLSFDKHIAIQKIIAGDARVEKSLDSAALSELARDNTSLFYYDISFALNIITQPSPSRGLLSSQKVQRAEEKLEAEFSSMRWREKRKNLLFHSTQSISSFA